MTHQGTIVISSSGDVEAPDLETGRFAAAITSSGDLTMCDLACETLTGEAGGCALHRV